jgi:hypothetical protein
MEAVAICKTHLGVPVDPIEAAAERLLTGIAPEDQSRGRSLEEGGRWSGDSRADLYRAVARGELTVERAAAAPRRNGRKPATRIRVTYLELARYRARRMVAAAAPIVKDAGGGGTP